MSVMTTGRFSLSMAAAVVAWLGASTTAFASPDTNSIKLVVQITVDGLRGGQLERFKDGFGDNGFRYLLNEGTVYTNAHYQHANTETIVGHTTLATGASPSEHGMIGNAWFDRESGALGYNIEDPDYPLLAISEDRRKGEQVDPAQKASRSDGRSPRKILAPTLSDTMAAYYAGRSKIFAVSGKDRGAVPMAGHVGKAFWFSTDSGEFVTSGFYYDEFPAWARKWNERRLADTYSGTSWELTGDVASYLLGDRDNRPYEADLRGYGRTFPHPYSSPDDGLFYTRLLVSPVGDELTADFAKTLMVSEGLGEDSVPDFLSISFSGVDAVNHFFGPSSLEQEAVIRRLDKTLADLIGFIEQKIGLDNVLIVLSADHGMADMAEYMSELGYKVGRLNLTALETTANEVGNTFGIDEVVRLFYRPYFYLDAEKIMAAGADTTEVARTIADALTALDGVALAVATADLGDLNGQPLLTRIRNNQHALRSGDIYIIQEPYWFLFEKGPIRVMHGTPYQFDTHVPIIFAGNGISAQRFHHRVHPVDVAPTISAVLGIGPPAMARGTVLDGVLERTN